MRRFEKLAIPLIIVHLVSQAAAYMAHHFSTPLMMNNDWSATTIELVSVPITLVLLAVNILVAIWLYQLARQDSGSPRIWALFGLIFGLTAVILFFVVRIHERLANPASGGQDAVQLSP